MITNSDYSMEEIFNPNEFTEKELLKLVYRDLHQLKKDFEEYKKNNDFYAKFQQTQTELLSLREEIKIEKAIQTTLRKESEKRIKVILAVGGLIIATLELLFRIF